MFCPSCSSEYRPGITRCAGCGVDLVADLTAPSTPRSEEPDPVASGPEPFLNYCGFLALEEAREARNHLRREGIRSEIAIREAPESDLHAPPREEYWIRISPRDFALAARILGYDEDRGESGGEEEGFVCSACGRTVSAESKFCPHCGERFEDS
jgi:hypothetical protein